MQNNGNYKTTGFSFLLKRKKYNGLLPKTATLVLLSLIWETKIKDLPHFAISIWRSQSFAITDEIIHFVRSHNFPKTNIS